MRDTPPVASNWRVHFDALRRFFLIRLLTIAVLLLAILGCVDLALRKSFEASSLLEDAVEIDSPRTLYAKLDALRNFQGLKIAVLGDSLVYGHALAEHGVKDWRAQNLTASLAEQLRKKFPGQPVMVMNFGMNGALPADLEHLIHLLLSVKPDAIMFDVTLRSFSTEFAKPGAQISRSWLPSTGLSREGTLSIGGKKPSAGQQLESFLANSWFLYRVRDFVQWRVLDDSPRDLVKKLRDAANSRLKNSPADPAEDALLLLMKAKQRYSSVALSDGNPQWTAFTRILGQLQSANQKTIIFYATENPDSLEELLPPDRHAALISRIKSAVSETNRHDIVFLPPLASLASEMFLDHVHLTASGYRVLSAALIDKFGQTEAR